MAKTMVVLDRVFWDRFRVKTQSRPAARGFDVGFDDLPSGELGEGNKVTVDTRVNDKPRLVDFALMFRQILKSGPAVW